MEVSIKFLTGLVRSLVALLALILVVCGALLLLVGTDEIDKVAAALPVVGGTLLALVITRIRTVRESNERGLVFMGWDGDVVLPYEEIKRVIILGRSIFLWKGYTCCILGNRSEMRVPAQTYTVLPERILSGMLERGIKASDLFGLSPERQ